jgi:hypothetical protein
MAVPCLPPSLLMFLLAYALFGLPDSSSSREQLHENSSLPQIARLTTLWIFPCQELDSWEGTGEEGGGGGGASGGASGD